jgi:hypothetical protein
VRLIRERIPAPNKRTIGINIPIVREVASDTNPIDAGIIATPTMAMRNARDRAVPISIPGVLPSKVMKPGKSGPTPAPATK